MTLPTSFCSPNVAGTLIKLTVEAIDRPAIKNFLFFFKSRLVGRRTECDCPLGSPVGVERCHSYSSAHSRHPPAWQDSWVGFRQALLWGREGTGELPRSFQHVRRSSSARMMLWWVAEEVKKTASGCKMCSMTTSVNPLIESGG